MTDQPKTIIERIGLLKQKVVRPAYCTIPAGLVRQLAIETHKPDTSVHHIGKQRMPNEVPSLDDYEFVLRASLEGKVGEIFQLHGMPVKIGAAIGVFSTPKKRTKK